MKLYRGTAGEDVRAILKHGIKPRRATKKNNWKHSVASHEHAVYLTSVYAGYFAHQAAKTSKLGIIEIETD
jgi:RNA:NAD 2'-phosphotransferase (TPT1/KptA family)